MPNDSAVCPFCLGRDSECVACNEQPDTSCPIGLCDGRGAVSAPTEGFPESQCPACCPAGEDEIDRQQEDDFAVYCSMKFGEYLAACCIVVGIVTLLIVHFRH